MILYQFLDIVTSAFYLKIFIFNIRYHLVNLQLMLHRYFKIRPKNAIFKNFWKKKKKSLCIILLFTCIWKHELKNGKTENNIEIKHAELNCAVKISQKKAIHNFQLTWKKNHTKIKNQNKSITYIIQERCC